MTYRFCFAERAIAVVALVCVAVYPQTSRAEDPTHVWTRTFGGAGTDVGNGIASARAASIVTVGRFEGTVDFDPGAGETQRTSNGRSDAFASSLDIDGGFEWAVTIGGSSGEEPLAVTTDSDRNVFVAGWYAGTVDFDPRRWQHRPSCLVRELRSLNVKIIWREL